MKMKTHGVLGRSFADGFLGKCAEAGMDGAASAALLEKTADDLDGLLPPGAYPWSGEGEASEYSTDTQLVPDAALDWIDSAADPGFFEIGKKMYRNFSDGGKALPIGKEGRRFLQNPVGTDKFRELLAMAREAGSWQGLAKRVHDEARSRTFGINCIPDNNWIPVTNALDYATRPFYAKGMPSGEAAARDVAARFAKGIRHNTTPPPKPSLANVPDGRAPNHG